MGENLFSGKLDAGFYLFTYSVFPITSIFVGLQTLSNSSNTSIAYWYLSILCSAVCCFHDCVNRWDSQVPIKNGKIFLMGFCVIVIIIYALVEMFYQLNQIELRCDYVLLIYFFPVLISTFDIISLYRSEMRFFKVKK